MAGTASFFALGGHSISVGQLVNRVRRELRLKVSVSDVYAAPSARALAARLAAAPAEEGLKVVPSETSTYPATYQQRSLEVMANLGCKASAALNLTFCCHVRCAEGQLDVERLRRAFEALVQRHDALRTTLHDARCEVASDLPCDFRVEAAPAAELAEWQMEQHDEAFDLRRGPLCRVRLLREAPQSSWILHWTLHHVSADLWSYTLLLRDLSEAYEQLRSGPVQWPDAAPQYRDYALQEQRLRGQVRAKDRVPMS